jgi:hypothetical protein
LNRGSGGLSQTLFKNKKIVVKICLSYSCILKQVLRIPTAHLCRGSGVAFVPQARTRNVLLQELRHACSRGGPVGSGGLSVAEAQLYLEDANWDLQVAHAAWAADNAWEAEQEQLQATTEVEAASADAARAVDAAGYYEGQGPTTQGVKMADLPPFPLAYSAGARSTLKAPARQALNAVPLPPGALTI